MPDLLSLPITILHEKLKKREISAVELTRAYFDEIKKRDNDIHAYLHITEERALAQAREADDLYGAGEVRSPLQGIPLALKDNMLLQGEPCTAGSRMLEEYRAAYDATVVRRLRDAGAVFLGKTNLDEFAMGSSTENSAYGATKNPYDRERVPGGSSGGSAAAVAAHLCAGALGSDTGGSIRQPASFCGVVGFKPSYGAVSRYGLVAMASSLDQIGPLATNVQDSRHLFEAIRGKDSFDATSADILPAHEHLSRHTVRIGVPKEYFAEGLDKDVEARVRDAVSKYEKAGATVKEVSLPHTSYALPVYYILMPSEVSANLARYDGIRYGMSVMRDFFPRAKRLAEKISVPSVARGNNDGASGISLEDVYIKTRAGGLGDEVQRRVMLGTYTLSHGYYDAYYLRAQKVRTRIIEDFHQVFNEVDVLMTPTTPTPAFRYGEKAKDPVRMYLSDIFTVSANLAGLPALSLPCGTVERDGTNLPVGLQIIGNLYHDEDVLEVGTWYDEGDRE